MIRCSSQVRRRPRSSNCSDRSLKRCNSLSNAKSVVRVTSIRSVSSGDKFRCVAAVRNSFVKSYHPCLIAMVCTHLSSISLVCSYPVHRIFRFPFLFYRVLSTIRRVARALVGQVASLQGKKQTHQHLRRPVRVAYSPRTWDKTCQ